MIKRIWESATWMTWGSYSAKGLAQVAFLPVILHRFSPAEIALWYLFITVIGFQILVDAGFVPTFVRVIAYASGGAAVEELAEPTESRSGTPNWKTIAAIYGTSRHLYARLSLAFTLMLATVGTAVLRKPISHVEDPSSAWFAWVVILAVSTISLRVNAYGTYLQGLNQIALVRRWEMLTSLGGILSGFIVLAFHGGILGLICSNQIWQVIDLLWKARLAHHVAEGRLREFRREPFHPEVLRVIWPSTWRSGVGIFMSYGLISASGLIYAQFGRPLEVASYLMGLRLFQMMTTFSTAPFYSCLPQYARLYAEGKREVLVVTAQRGMRRSHWLFAAGFVGLGLVGQPLITIIKGHVPFPSPLMWSLLGLAFFFERYGAMHIQLYSTTNRIIWHIANGVTGILYLISSLLLFKSMGAYAFPLGILIGYAGFYSWYTARHTYQAFDLEFLSFERQASLIPFAVVLLFSLSAVFRM